MTLLRQLRQLFGGRLKIPLMLGIALTVIILAEIGWFAVRPSPLPATEDLEPLDALAMLGLSDPSPTTGPPLGQFREVLRRPIFEQNRKPVITAQSKNVGVIDAAELARTWRLTGVVISGERSFAMLENQKTRKAIALDLEEFIDGWQLTDIVDGAITLRSAHGATELSLYRNDGTDSNDAAIRNGVIVRKTN
jgi:hypothetical protein